MGVATKGKRKILVDGETYYWYVVDDYEVLDLGADKRLTVLSESKQFLIHYPINQSSDGENLIIILWRTFGGEGPWGKCWQRIVSPKWELNGVIAPSSVANLIRWCIKDKEVEFVNYRGQKV